MKIIIPYADEINDYPETIYGQWVIAKPENWHGFMYIKQRIVFAWNVLIGKAEAFKYRGD